MDSLVATIADEVWPRFALIGHFEKLVFCCYEVRKFVTNSEFVCRIKHLTKLSWKSKMRIILLAALITNALFSHSVIAKNNEITLDPEAGKARIYVSRHKFKINDEKIFTDGRAKNLNLFYTTKGGLASSGKFYIVKNNDGHLSPLLQVHAYNTEIPPSYYFELPEGDYNLMILNKTSFLGKANPVTYDLNVKSGHSYHLVAGIEKNADKKKRPSLNNITLSREDLAFCFDIRKQGISKVKAKKLLKKRFENHAGLLACHSVIQAKLIKQPKEKFKSWVNKNQDKIRPYLDKKESLNQLQ